MHLVITSLITHIIECDHVIIDCDHVIISILNNIGNQNSS